MASQHPTPPRGLTAPFIDALRPAGARYEVTDRRAPGLVLRVYPSGAKSFRWTVRIDAGARVVTLGEFSSAPMPGRLTLAEARAWLDRLKAGHDAEQLDAVVRDLERWRRAPPTPDGRDTSDSLRDVAEEFYRRRIVPHRRRPEAVRDVLDRDLLPILGSRPIRSLSPRDVAAAVERVVDRGAPVHAGKVLQVVKQLGRFAEARGYTDRNPAASLDAKDLGVEQNVSSRALTDEEIPVFWRALDLEAGPVRVERPDPRTGKVQVYQQRYQGTAPATRAALRILLLTGVRSGELLQATRDELDLKAATWTIPVDHQKLNPAAAKRAKPFVVPLAPTALDLFRELEGIARAARGEDGKPSPYVVTGPAGPYDSKSFGHALRRLCRGPLAELAGGEVTPHDLRRTVRTGLGRLRIPLHICERVLNHSLGRLAQVYDVGDYLEERREALERWDLHVRGLLDPAAKVVSIAAGASR